MKIHRSKFLLSIVLILISLSLNAQFKAVGNSAVWQIGFNEEFADNLNLKERYADEIKNIEAKTNGGPGIDNVLDVLFVGSSSIRGWRSVVEDMKPLSVLNNGFGGSTIRDILYHYDVVVKPFKTKKIVLYVENDIIIESSLDTYILFDMFRIFTHKVFADFPGVKLYIISLKPSPSRANVLGKQVLINEMLKSYAERVENLEYIDVASKMVINGEIDTTLFIGDKLHMNPKGYELWTQIVKPMLNQ